MKKFNLSEWCKHNCMLSSTIGVRIDYCTNGNCPSGWKPGVIGNDNICPTTNEPCDDECCPPGAVCNLWGSDNNIRPMENDK